MLLCEIIKKLHFNNYKYYCVYNLRKFDIQIQESWQFRHIKFLLF